LAGRFDLPDVFDFVVVSLSQATSLLSDSLPAQVPNYPLVEVEGQAITVSSLAVKFGTNFKGQLAAVVLFNIVNGNGNALREGWTQVRKHPSRRCQKLTIWKRSLRCFKIYFCIRYCRHACCRWRISLEVYP
jgi:Sec7-like guanine-nucleotide exchange factor